MKEIYSAFIKAQSEIRGAVKDSKNPHFNSKYADIESVIEAIKIPLAHNNLAFIQPIFSENDKWYMNTILIHDSGQSIESGKVEIIIQDKNNPQKLKSSVTYFRRTCLLSMCGIPDTDDDGNAASAKGNNDNAEKKEHGNKKPVYVMPNKPKNEALISDQQWNELKEQFVRASIPTAEIAKVCWQLWKLNLKSPQDLKLYQYEHLMEWISKSASLDDFNKQIEFFMTK